MMRLRTSLRTHARPAAAAASNSPAEPLYRSQFSTRWAAKTLPPDTEVMWVIRGRIPASRRNLTTPRWYRLARKPPPERARPIRFLFEFMTPRGYGLALAPGTCALL